MEKHRYLELLHYCRQYYVLKKKLPDCYGVGSPILSDLPRGGAKTSVVERQAERAEKYRDKIDKIERAARQASDGSREIYLAIIQNVASGVTYEHISVPCGKRQFYESRRRFFWLLDKEV